MKSVSRNLITSTIQTVELKLVRILVIMVFTRKLDKLISNSTVHVHSIHKTYMEEVTRRQNVEEDSVSHINEEADHVKK